MIYVFLGLAAFAFVYFMQVFHLLPRVKSAVSIAQQARLVIQSDALSDDQKQSMVQSASLDIFSHAFAIAVRLIACAIAGLIVILLGYGLGFYAIDDVIGASTDWTFLIVSMILMIVVVFVLK